VEKKIESQQEDKDAQKYVSDILLSAPDAFLQKRRMATGRRKAAYRVISLMSGTSLDGIDIVCVVLNPPTARRSKWKWQIEDGQTVPFTTGWKESLRIVGGQTYEAVALVQLDVEFGKYLGEQVRRLYGERLDEVDFIASHGHTIFHQPAERGLTFQLGHGGALAAAAGVPVVCDFRSADVALGGQGAPLVPIGDRLLFPDFGCCLNLGGIANLSAEVESGRRAFDVCAVNQLLNVLAAEVGLPYDDNGQLARAGRELPALRAALDAPAFFEQQAPKSLGREWVEENSLAVLAAASDEPLADRLSTTVRHIAGQLGRAIRTTLADVPSGTDQRVLVTGGGAYNGFLIECLQKEIGQVARVVVPEPEVVEFKEALIFALLGVLRWRGEVNTLASATGASRNSSGGAVYAP
jgi:anhydro-N-acetylmuramic acid kinase